MKYIKGLVLTLGLSISTVSFASENVITETQLKINEQIISDFKIEVQKTLDESFRDLILKIDEDIEITIETSLPTPNLKNDNNLYSIKKNNKSLAISE